jgi:Pheophorbide a oxygenase
MSYATPLAPGRARSIVRFVFLFKKPNSFAAKVARFFINATPRWLSHLRINAVIEVSASIYVMTVSY